MVNWNRKGLGMKQFQRISHDIGIMGGKACVAETRITVGMILTQISEGATTSELIIEYPCLTEDDVAEVLKYAAWVVGAREDLIVPA